MNNLHPLLPSESALLIAQVAGAAALLGFVAMMFLYFRSGPQRVGDRVMSTATLTAAVFQSSAFFTAEDVPLLTSLASLALLVIANLLFWSARVAHGRVRPAAVFGEEIPKRVVRQGPYRVIRHPFYLAYSLTYLALAIVGDRWWQYLVAAVVFALYNRAAAQEERLLGSCPAIGEEYAEYRRETWRWFPLFW